MTAGRVFRISPPREGSKSTHQTSPRSMRFRERRIGDQGFGPLERLLFARLIGSHVAVGSFDIPRHDVGTGEFLDKLADAPPANGPVEALINSLADCDCELSVHRSAYTYCTRVGSTGSRLRVCDIKVAELPIRRNSQESERRGTRGLVFALYQGTALVVP